MTFIKNIKILLIGLVLFLSSCAEGLLDHYGNEVCDYSVRLRYDYNEENSTTSNMLEFYVYTVDEYIFDEYDILFAVNRILPDTCDGVFRSELDLPPGRYSVIAVGNMGEPSEVWDVLGSVPEKGVTHRDDMRMSLFNAEKRPGNTYGPCERLYYGYRTFTVKPTEVSYIRVDMINAYMRLYFRVTWKKNKPPRGDYYVVLDAIPSEYGLMPELYYPIGSFDCTEHDPEASDRYEWNTNAIIHHIPYTCYVRNTPSFRNVLSYRIDTRVNVDNEMWGEFMTYRIRNRTNPMLSIYNADGEEITRKVDLGGYFRWHEIDLDSELRQDYEISIEVDGNNITINSLMKLSDWDEGGFL